MSSDLYIGLMSGTSMDAIDAALVDFSGEPKVIASHSEPIQSDFKEELLALCEPGFNGINRYGRLDVQFARLSAQVCQGLLEKSNYSANDIAAIGSHGQTVRHCPDAEVPFTLQLGDPNVIAQLTGIKVVADFRRRDIVLGGQGAPLTPAFHEALFRCQDKERVIVNIGGFANITYLPRDLSKNVLGFDTGPGNALMDAWCDLHLKKSFDMNGAWAASGQVCEELLKLFLQDDFFNKPAPKSTGREYFNMTWLQNHLGEKKYKPEDVQATLLELTARTIVDEINHLTTEGAEIMLCGGGAQNLFLIERIKILAGKYDVTDTNAYGVPTDLVEAMAFAWLARQNLLGQPGNLPAVTGAKQACLLGGVYCA